MVYLSIWERRKQAKKLGRVLKENDRLPAAIQKRLMEMYAGKTGLSGPQIIDFFCTFSMKIRPYKSLQPPPRRAYLFEDCLARLSTKVQRRAIGALLDHPGPFAYGSPPTADTGFVRAWLGDTPSPSFTVPEPVRALNWERVEEHLRKANDRLGAGDVDGAITSARTLLETTCHHILEDVGVPCHPDGNLGKLYQLACGHLELGSHRYGEGLRRVLGGCSSIVGGLSEMRNRLGDAHGKGLTDPGPEVRHARLCVYASIALVYFLLETHSPRARRLGQAHLSKAFPELRLVGGSDL